MKCTIKNITVGILDCKDLILMKDEVKTVELTENIRHYVAAGYIKMLDMYEDAPNIAPRTVHSVKKDKTKFRKYIGGN